MEYSAESLAEVADHFDGMADQVAARLAKLNAHRTHPTREMHQLKAEESTWRAAASILRQTKVRQ